MSESTQPPKGEQQGGEGRTCKICGRPTGGQGDLCKECAAEYARYEKANPGTVFVIPGGARMF